MAADMATIGFAARTDGLLKAEKGLNDLRGAAKDAQIAMAHLESTTGKTNSSLAATRQKLNPAYRAMVEYRGRLREISMAAKQGAISRYGNKSCHYLNLWARGYRFSLKPFDLGRGSSRSAAIPKLSMDQAHQCRARHCRQYQKIR